VLLLNLLIIGLVIWPSFRQQVKPELAKGLHKWYDEEAIIHAVLGITAELVGLYIVIVAGTNVLPPWLRFKHWKWWMRAELVLWAIVLLSGVGTYCGRRAKQWLTMWMVFSRASDSVPEKPGSNLRHFRCLSWILGIERTSPGVLHA
jgi:hypothetical protein